ncbi:hypothetical protein HI914_01980 [Erysiphe necator]|nr:hypothetical protein HI914_01980 [Erysiphe necator]
MNGDNGQASLCTVRRRVPHGLRFAVTFSRPSRTCDAMLSACSSTVACGLHCSRPKLKHMPSPAESACR